MARLLGMNEHDWVALWRYALGQDPPYPLHPRSGEVVSGAWQEVLDGVSHMAYISDRSWNLLAHNEPFAALFPGRRVPENTMRWMAVARRPRVMLPRWETAWAPLVLPQLRAARAADPGDPVLAGIEREVLADPAAARIYGSAGAYLRPVEGERPVHHAERGPGWVSVCAAQPMAAPRARLIVLPFRPGEEPPAAAPGPCGLGPAAASARAPTSGPTRSGGPGRSAGRPGLPAPGGHSGGPGGYPAGHGRRRALSARTQPLHRPHHRRRPRRLACGGRALPAGGQPRLPVGEPLAGGAAAAGP